MTSFHLVFLAVAFYAVFVQVRSYAFAEAIAAGSDPRPVLEAEYARLLRIRRVMSPAIAGLAAVLVALGSFVIREHPSLLIGILLTSVWALAAIGDIFVEGSYSASDEAKKATFYIAGMALFILVTLGLGVGLIVNALSTGSLSAGTIAGSAAAALLMGGLAYLTLDVSPENLGIVLVYTVAVTTLLCGGLLSALTGQPHLAFVGIAYFFSDWCVGLRDFGKRVPAFLKRNLLIVILILYYSIMLISIDLVL